MTHSRRSGDDGNTQLGGGGRVPKDRPLLELLGSLEEVAARVAWVRCHPTPETRSLGLGEALDRIARDLHELAVVLATPRHERDRIGVRFEDRRADRLHAHLLGLEESLPPATDILLPGGSEVAARLALTRSAARAAERCAVSFARSERLPGSVVRYLNRLGSWLFAAARAVNHHGGFTARIYRPTSEDEAPEEALGGERGPEGDGDAGG